MTVEPTAAGYRFNEKLSAFCELTKPGITFLVVLSSAAGFYLASSEPLDLSLLLHTVLGTVLLSGGAAVFNEFIEREADGKMRRTCRRPLPSGRLDERETVVFGGMLIVSGSLYLALLTNILAAFLGMATWAVYLFVYTPLKTKSPMCTTVGAIPGAMPTLIGWAAARGHLDLHALVLFGILFAWQFPHFLSISWIYKEDYKRAGFVMLSSVDPDGRRTGGRILAFTVILLVLSVVPATAGLTGIFYLIGALLLGLAFVWYGFEAALYRSATSARHVLLASVTYLPLLFILMVIDKTFG
ncbi:heme o synthase [Acidobacteria bacterium AH-259-D05]|nr:heme o synthase [Acidobacteria bacterium AH-259-D05]